MSRSRRKTPITGITSATSEKADKLAAHRRERRMIRQTLHLAELPDVLPLRKEVSNPWAYAKDGKHYWRSGLRPEDLRK